MPTANEAAVRKPLSLLWICGAAVCGFVLGIGVLWMTQAYFSRGASQPDQPVVAATPEDALVRTPLGFAGVTSIYAHNLRLHQGPNFRVYIRWIRGQLQPIRKGVVPSFDDPESFYLNITNGVLRVNIGDFCNYLNAKSADSPLTDLKMTGVGEHFTITGKMHKVLTFPVELTGVIKVASNNRVLLHVEKINVLKIPFKRMLGGMDITLASLLKKQSIKGLQVEGNDLFLSPSDLLPPPHIRGQLTRVSMASPDLEAVYGDVTEDLARVVEWRNYLQLRDGTLGFGKLTMRKVDLIMIDISPDEWFDLDLAHYQDQLINGYSRMTPQQGLQIFMPDVSDLKSKGVSQISIEWFKNRKVAPPSTVIVRQRN